MESNTPARLIFLWCVPRSLSTAFEKMMAHSNQFTVIGEPFIDVYKNSLISKSHFQDSLKHFSQIYGDLMNQSHQQPVFVKDMGYHAEPFITDQQIRSARHTFLIRAPQFSIPSLYKMRPEFTEDQPGFEGQLKMFQKVVEVTGNTPYVIDAEELKTRASEVVADYFRWIEHPLPTDVLNWPKGSRNDWKGRESWHTDAINSQGFEAREGSKVLPSMPPKVANSVKRNTSFYETLLKHVTLK